MITINSKFNIGDKVWTIANDQVVQTTILDLDISADHGACHQGVPAFPAEGRLRWALEVKRPEPGMIGVAYNILMGEDKLFSTKEELLASL